jgi:2-keto-4-pentenoate hydratase/2-oxohepta-3-ene-1,7-dioic acid hydratase in catechol pathway
MSTLRVANVLYGERDVFAIEHRGKLLSVASLEQRFALDSSPSRFTEHSSFRTRVFSLGLAGVEEMAEAIGDSRPPTEALLNPSQCVFLPPTIPTAALLEFSMLSEGKLAFQRAYARCLRGQDAPLPIPSDESAAQLEVQIAAILGEDVSDASAQEATKAIVGFAPMTLWTFPSRQKVSPGWGQYRLGQLGPCLVVLKKPFRPEEHSVRLLVNGEVVVASQGRSWGHSFGQMISFASEGCELLAGDVVGSGPIARMSSDGRRALRVGDRVTAEVSGMGTLSGVIIE